MPAPLPLGSLDNPTNSTPLAGPCAPKLKPRVKALWLQALRGGAYRQCRSRLRLPSFQGGSGFCCLGVLTDLAVQEGVGAWGPAGYWHSTKSSDYASGSLSAEVIAWAFDNPLAPFTGGLRDPRVQYGQVKTHLSSLNDGAADLGAGLDFCQIANIIEEQF